MLPIQNAESSKALAASLGLKGKIRLSVDEVEVPAVITDYLPNTPYSAIIPIGCSGAAGPVAVNFSAISIEPGSGGILVIDRIEIANTSGSDGDFNIRVLTQVDVGVFTTVSSAQAFNFNSPLDGGGVRTNGALCRVISHTAILGATILRHSVLDNTTYAVELPGGYALYGDDPRGFVALVVWGTTLNEGIIVNFYGRVFLNKG